MIVLEGEISGEGDNEVDVRQHLGTHRYHGATLYSIPQPCRMGTMTSS